jgi:aspartyl-tRNA(Asn)/glutamyl-tRNA(Gln) amidotransferase subunit A
MNLEEINLLNLSAEKALKLIKNKEVSPLTVVTESLKAIKKSDLNSFITLSDEGALAKAKESTDRARDGNVRPLEGLPIAVKDNFCVSQVHYPNIQTTCGSKILIGFKPTYESTVTKKLTEAGAIMVGKANMDEFAMGSSNEHSHFGPVKNPWDKSRVPGGSSGGSAAAVAANLCYAAIGTDTGGSVRCPASFCGIVGIKPTYGRCSRFGVIPLASSFDQPGVFARNVQDGCLVMDQIMGYCPQDSRSIDVPAPKLAEVIGDVSGMRIGYIAEHMFLVEPTVRSMWENCLQLLRSRGAQIVPISMSSFNTVPCPENINPCYRWLAVYYSIMPVEAFSNLARFDGIKFGSYVDAPTLKEAYCRTRDQFGQEVKKRLLLGCNNIINESHIFADATSYRQVIKDEFDKVFQKIDSIICPTMPHEAFKIGGTAANSIDEYVEDIFTVVANIIGAPAMSVPSGLGPNGLPLGIQVMCNRFEEEKMIRIAKVIEEEVGFVELSKRSKNV